MNPVHGLLRSRKFLVLLLDTCLSLILYFVGKYAPADLFADVKFLIAALQPVFFGLIAAIAYEDGQAKANANYPEAAGMAYIDRATNRAYWEDGGIDSHVSGASSG